MIRSIVLAGAAGLAYGQVAPPAPATVPVAPIDPKPAPAIAPAPVPVAPVGPKPTPAIVPAPPVRPMDLDFDFDFDFDFVPGGVIGGIPGGVAGGVPGGVGRLQIEMERANELVALANQKIELNKFKLFDKRGELDRVSEELKALAEAKPADAFFMAQAMPKPAVAPMPPGGFGGKIGRRDREDSLYRRGAEYLDRREWDRAAEAFDQVIEGKGAKADGAYYWKAYALSKQAQSDKALATLAELQKTYPNSRWLNDAKALEVEVRQSRGQAISPEKESDEELKLLAINSLVSNDPERAVPLLQKILQSHDSPKVKERALFVLAQSRTPQAREVVVRFAKGGGNPDLQSKAVEYLGIYGGKENTQILSEVYSTTNDPSLRRSILHSFMRAGEKDRLVNAARTEQNQELRIEAIRLLGAMGAQPELAQMYSSDASQEARKAIIDSIYAGGNKDKLIELAKAEKDAELRTRAIHRLGNMRRASTADALVSLYSSEGDKGVKSEIIRALYQQGAAKEIVDIARKESDPEMKREAVRMLSNMKSKEATDYLIELLNK